MAKYKGVMIMNDGAKNGTLNCDTPEEVRQRLKVTLQLSTRYYKRNGVDYGAIGKLFTYEEEHGGVKKAIIYKVTTEPHEEITDELKR